MFTWRPWVKRHWPISSRCGPVGKKLKIMAPGKHACSTEFYRSLRLVGGGTKPAGLPQGNTETRMSQESIVVYEQRMKRSRKERIIMLRNLPVTAYGKRPKPFSGNDGAGSAAYHNNQVIEATIDDLYN